MKKSTLHCLAMLLVQQSFTFAAPGKGTIHAQAAMPDWANMIHGDHQVAMYTEGINSQQGALHAHVMNPANKQTTLLYTGGAKQFENAQHVHHYLQSINADTSKVRHVALEPHRQNELSHEKHLITPEKTGMHLDNNFELHPWEHFGDQLMPGVPVNTIVMPNTPTDYVIDNLKVAKNVGGKLNYVNHHLSGAMNRPSVEKQMEDIHKLGENVHDLDGHLIWTDADTSWDVPRSAMTEPISKLKQIQPKDHVKFAKDSSTFLQNKAHAVDRIGQSVNPYHVNAIPEGEYNNENGMNYKGFFNKIRNSDRNDPEIQYYLGHLEHNWHPNAVADLYSARGKASTDREWANINKHLDHIEDPEKYIQDIKKPGFNVEFQDAKNQAALYEAAHNPQQDSQKGAYFAPVSHYIDENMKLGVNKLGRVDPRKPIHWHVFDANSDRAMRKTAKMMRGKYGELARQHGYDEETSTSGS